MTQQPPMTRASTAPVLTVPQLKFKLAKQRPLLFKPRLTQFDLSNTDKSNDAFRGFYTLFWIAMGLYVITAVVRCYEQEGILLSLGFYRLFSKDGWGLLISDLFMVSMTVFSVLFSKLLLWNVLSYETVGFMIQHVCQVLFLGASIYWTFVRNWPWVQSGFFTMHTIVMMMKMHSYTALNGDLSVKLRRLKHLKAQLPKLLKENKTDTSIIQHMEAEIQFLEEEMVHGSTKFPNNITVVNFLDYLLVPSLVYWMEYPRTQK